MNISHLIYFVLQYFIRGFVCCQRIICKINKVLFVLIMKNMNVKFGLLLGCMNVRSGRFGVETS